MGILGRIQRKFKYTARDKIMGRSPNGLNINRFPQTEAQLHWYYLYICSARQLNSTQLDQGLISYDGMVFQMLQRETLNLSGSDFQ